jgi:threonine-phosphate decarboxylase
MREQGFPRGRILDFSSDVNPLGFPDMVRTSIAEHVEDLRDYPDPDALALREAIAAHHRVPVAAVLPGNGSAELIPLLTRLRPRSSCVVTVPTFTEYAWAAEQAGATVACHQLDEAQGFQPDFSSQDWTERVREADLVFLCNPNNPTGVALPREQVLRLADRCRERGGLLVVDEAYVEFTDRPEDVTVLPDAPHRGNLVVVRSVTKLFAVPGLRLGYLVAAEPLVGALRALQQPWPLNAFAVAVGVELFRQVGYIVRTRALLGELRQAFQRAIAELSGLRPFPTAVNFTLCRIEPPTITSSWLAHRLAEQGILIRNCDSFPGLEAGRFIRLAVRTRGENEQLCRALREALGHAG